MHCGAGRRAHASVEGSRNAMEKAVFRLSLPHSSTGGDDSVKAGVDDKHSRRPNIALGCRSIPASSGHSETPSAYLIILYIDTGSVSFDHDIYTLHTHRFTTV